MIDDPFRWQLEHLARSQRYLRKLLVVNAGKPSLAHAPIDLGVLLGAILLIEMHQRPAPLRGAEWVVSAVVPKFLRPPITRGPLQIANGPWKFNVAVGLAYGILEQSVAGTDTEAFAVTAAATAWNGKAVRQPCSAYGYGEVLRLAYVIADRALAELARHRQAAAPAAHRAERLPVR